MARTTTKKDATQVASLQIHMPVLMPAHQLNPVGYNPNKMAPEKYEALKRTIREDGFVDPLVVQKHGNNIIGGHHRWKAIKEICVEDEIQVPELPCIVLDVGDAQARKLNLKLNNIKGEPDAHLLAEMLSDMFPVEDRAEEVLRDEAAALGLEYDDVTKLLGNEEDDKRGAKQRSASDDVKMVHLSLDEKAHKKFLALVEKLGPRYATESVTDTVVAAIKEVAKLPAITKKKRIRAAA